MQHTDKVELTAKQIRICELMVAGFSDAEIAMELGLSKRTVSDHAARAADRLLATNRASLGFRFCGWKVQHDTAKVTRAKTGSA